MPQLTPSTPFYVNEAQSQIITIYLSLSFKGGNMSLVAAHDLTEMDNTAIVDPATVFPIVCVYYEKKGVAVEKGV